MSAIGEFFQLCPVCASALQSTSIALGKELDSLPRGIQCTFEHPMFSALGEESRGYQMATMDGAKPIPQQGCGLYKSKAQGSVEEASCTSAQLED